jgi:hypothetical protein
MIRKVFDMAQHSSMFEKQAYFYKTDIFRRCLYLFQLCLVDGSITEVLGLSCKEKRATV